MSKNLHALIPLIRRAVPNLIAQDLLGVQPLSNSPGWFITAHAEVDGEPWYTVAVSDHRIAAWLTEHDSVVSILTEGYVYVYDINQSVLALLILRWA